MTFKLMLFAVAVGAASYSSVAANSQHDYSVSNCPTAEEPIRETWHRFAGDGFVIDFPCAPAQVDKVEEKDNLVLAGWTTLNNFALIVSKLSRPVSADEARSLLEKGVAAQTGDPKTTRLIESKTIKWGALEGRELSFVKSGNAFVGRMFIHGDRFYLLSVNEAAGGDLQVLRHRAERFFASFAIASR